MAGSTHPFPSGYSQWICLDEESRSRCLRPFCPLCNDKTLLPCNASETFFILGLGHHLVSMWPLPPFWKGRQTMLLWMAMTSGNSSILQSSGSRYKEGAAGVIGTRVTIQTCIITMWVKWGKHVDLQEGWQVYLYEEFWLKWKVPPWNNYPNIFFAEAVCFDLLEVGTTTLKLKVFRSTWGYTTKPSRYGTGRSLSELWLVAAGWLLIYEACGSIYQMTQIIHFII